MDKKDLKDILRQIKEKIERDVEAGCIFGDDSYPDCDAIYYILPPDQK